jgi:hypothetical protein
VKGLNELSSDKPKVIEGVINLQSLKVIFNQEIRRIGRESTSMHQSEINNQIEMK